MNENFANTPPPTDPYTGIRVVDLTVAQQGPLATQVLADFGADVIKIERPPSGDPMRGSNTSGRLGAAHHGSVGVSPAFIACNRNKRSLVLDLKQPDGRNVLLELLRRADVFVSNFRPGVLERLGVDHPSLARLNPRLIHATASGYGADGPYAHRKGQDMAAQCLSGLAARSMRSPEARPVAPGYNVCDLVGGLLLAQGIMAALAERAHSGLGQAVSTNLLNAAVFADLLGHAQTLNTPSAPTGAPNPTYHFYRAADGRWVHLIDAFTPDPLHRICRALELPGTLADDPRFTDCSRLSPSAARELEATLAAAVARLPVAEIVRRFDAQDMLAVPVNSPVEALEDPQVRHNGMVIEAAAPDGRPVRSIGFPVRLSRTPARLRRAYPALGADGQTVLAEILNYPPDRIHALRASGAVA